jgi:hypothetical protein
MLLMMCAITTFADEDAELRRYLSFLAAAHIGDDYDAVKKLAPEAGALQKDAGDNNTEALVTTKVGAIVLHGEFNFSKGHLVSHGFETGELTHAEAHDFLLRCVAILEELYGPSARRIELPTENDGPRDSIGISFNWHKNETIFELDFHYRRDFATVSWGAQAEGAKR